MNTHHELLLEPLSASPEVAREMCLRMAFRRCQLQLMTDLGRGLSMCSYRAFIAEGLSVGIERCYLRQHLGDMLVRSPDRWERQRIAAHLVVMGT